MKRTSGKVRSDKGIKDVFSLDSSKVSITSDAHFDIVIELEAFICETNRVAKGRWDVFLHLAIYSWRGAIIIHIHLRFASLYTVFITLGVSQIQMQNFEMRSITFRETTQLEHKSYFRVLFFVIIWDLGKKNVPPIGHG